MNKTTFTVDGTTLTIERVFIADKNRVWQAWEDPEVFAKWWGPKGWSTTVKHSDFTPNGYRLYGMKCEDENQGEWFGKESWGKMHFEEITPYDSFSYIDFFTDDQGTVTEGLPSVKTTNELIEVDGGTKFISRGYYDSEEAIKTVMDMGMEEGVRQTWDRLEELLAKAEN